MHTSFIQIPVMFFHSLHARYFHWLMQSSDKYMYEGCTVKCNVAKSTMAMSDLPGKPLVDEYIGDVWEGHQTMAGHPVD